MYFLTKFCCTCLANNTNLLPVVKSSDINSKLSECFKEVDWNCIEQLYICTPCQNKLDIAFEFRQTCLKSAEALQKYVKILIQEGGPVRSDINVMLTKIKVPELSVDDKLKSMMNSNVVFPITTSAVVPGTNIMVNPCSFYNILPINTVLPMVSQSINCQPKIQLSIGPQQITVQPINFEHGSKMFNKTIIIKNTIAQTGQQLLNPTLPVKPHHKDSLVEDILNNEESEEMNISVDPLALGLCIDESSNEVDANNDSNEGKFLEVEDMVNNKLTRRGSGKIFSCGQCGAVFDKGRELSIHKRTNIECRMKYFEKGVKAAFCPKCNGVFSTQQYLAKHIVRCEFIKVKSKQNVHLNKDKQNVYGIAKKTGDGHPIERVNIEVEPEIVEIENNLPLAQANEDPIQIEPTSTSIKSDTFYSNLDIKLKLFQCQFCKKKFQDAWELQSHLPIHYNYFSCCCCNNTFTDVKEIPLHMVTYHYTMETVKCVSCNEKFQTLESITKHSHLHLKNLMFECHICLDKYKDIQELRIHIDNHFLFNQMAQ